MKKSILFFVILPLLTLLIISPAQSENLIKNPGFEEVDATGKLLNWSFWLGNTASEIGLDKATYAILPVNKSHTIKAFNPQETWTMVSQEGIKVAGDTEYLFSAKHIESKHFSRTSIAQLSEYDAGGKLLKQDYLSTNIPPSPDWAVWEKKFTTQPATTTLSLAYWPMGTGTAWLDDFSLVKFAGSDQEKAESLLPYYEKDFINQENWEAQDLVFTPLPGGAKITATKSLGFLKGYVAYDKLHPCLQIKIDSVEEGARWMLVDLSQGTEKISAPDNRAGVFTFDLRNILRLPEKGQILLGIYFLGEGKSLALNGIRTVSQPVAEKNSWGTAGSISLASGFSAGPADIQKWKNTGLTIKTENNASKITESNPDNNYGRLDSPEIYLNVTEYPYLTISLSHEPEKEYGWSLALNNETTLSPKQYTKNSGIITYDLREKTGWNGKQKFFLSLYVAGEGKELAVNWLKISNKPAEASYQLSGEDAQRGYLCYPKKPFAVYTYATLPEPGETGGKMSIFASPGEYEPATFLVYAGKDLKEVKIEAGNLKDNNNHIIPAENIDIRIMKVWYQAGNTGAVGPAAFVPELLLKDDSLITPDHEKRRNVLHFEGLPLDGPQLKPINIPENSSKQVWLTVRVPQDVFPGRYTSRIKIMPANAPSQEIELEVSVLPIKLQEPDKIYGIYYVGSNLKEIEDMRAHGLNSGCSYNFSLSLKKKEGGKWEFDLTSLKKEIDVWVKNGFTKPIVLALNPYVAYFPIKVLDGNATPEDEELFVFIIKEVERFRKENNYPEFLYYGIDEPAYDTTGKTLEQCGKVFALMQKAGGKTTTAITLAGAEKLGALIDVPIYDEPSANSLFPTPSLNPKTELHYWHPLENPIYDRFRFGLFVWKAGLDGAYPYAYRHVFSYAPYDDFGKEGDVRNEIYAYPSQGGPIPTIQWEGMREGIDDVRYLTTLANLIEKAQKTTGNQNLTQEIAAGKNLLENLPEVFNANIALLYQKLKPEDFQDYRRKISEQIMRLQALLK